MTVGGSIVRDDRGRRWRLSSSLTVKENPLLLFFLSPQDCFMLVYENVF